MSGKTPNFASAFGAKAAPAPLEDFTELTFGLDDGMLPSAANALAVQGDGTIQVGGFTLTSVGLQINGNTTIDEWAHLGTMLQKLDGSLQWLIGDWLVHGERAWGKTYSEVAEKTGYSAKTLREYVYVASKVDMSIRMDKLTFGHHQLVAGLPPVRQQFWLIKAADNDWSISQLRDAISLKPPPPSDNVTRFQSKLLRLKSDFIKAGEGERMQFGILLRRLADEIENGG